jgi:hypothetical protein|tara:strand:- start:9909 stop:10283 length:375 start_codon:yes stop_codon:yes gene_type:complete
MKIFDEVNEDNLIIFAARHYYNPKCIDVEEFYEDLNRVKYVKRLVNRYTGNEDKKLSVRLILNHIVVIFNVFGVEASIKILKLKLKDEHWSIIKPFLIFLKYIEYDDFIGIDMDARVVEELRKI